MCVVEPWEGASVRLGMEIKVYTRGTEAYLRILERIARGHAHDGEAGAAGAEHALDVGLAEAALEAEFDAGLQGRNVVDVLALGDLFQLAEGL